MRTLPNLNGLRAFEAAARCLSFTRAAEELSVTQAAVSHQIKSLESQLRVRLFARGNRSISLTDEGRLYYPEVQRAFTLLREATTRIARNERTGLFTISTLASFAARWLVPRLGRFTEAHPDIDLRLATTQEIADFSRDNVDSAIRYGRGTYPGLRSTLLLTEEVFPVCSPELLEEKPLREPHDLLECNLLHDHDIDEWRNWLAAAGVESSGLEAGHGHWFKDSGLLLQAAVTGQGVALGRSVLASDDIAAGRLVCPFDIILPSEYAYYFVCPEAAAERPKVVAFREWLLAEVARG